MTDIPLGLLASCEIIFKESHDQSVDGARPTFKVVIIHNIINKQDSTNASNNKLGTRIFM